MVYGLPFRLLGAALQVPVDAISALILVVERASHFRDLPKLYGVCMLHCWVSPANIVLPFYQAELNTTSIKSHQLLVTLIYTMTVSYKECVELHLNTSTH